MTAIAGALGSVIGYVGAEVADRSLFERLLWPQRFYNDFNFSVFVKLALLMPMGGPVHKAAIQTLEKFRKNGLYNGASRGDMLGTAFFEDAGYTCREVMNADLQHGLETKPDQARNNFWVEAIANVHARGRGVQRVIVGEEGRIRTSFGSGEFGEKSHRAIQMVYEVVLELDSLDSSDAAPPTEAILDENSITWRAIAGILSSEVSAVGLAIFMGVYKRVPWLACFLCVPLFLRLIPLWISVRREPITVWSGRGDTRYKIFEFDKSEWGFAIIGGPEREDEQESVIRQFFLHYGHPRRTDYTFFGDRSREICSMILVALFVLYFPAGLVSLIWMDSQVQYIWLGYQVYTILAMHFVRLFGGGGAGRTEKHAAALFQSGKSVWLKGTGNHAVKATLTMTEVESIKAGRQYVKYLIE
ncbi:hypothetical protein BDZ45DRAFT_539306, partial [Acephala macrosclerotiorum]